MINPLISIIVPCFNVSFFLKKGLLSVFNQNYKNWECIIVNDGSTDKSQDLINEFTNKDDRFKSIIKKNGGLSSARNSGLEIAAGDCIYFFDPDDLLDTNCLYNLVGLFDENIDIVIGQSARVYNQTTNVIDTLEHSERRCKLINDENFIHLALQKPFSVVAWNKLYKSTFIKNHNISFKNGIVHEDELWFFETMYYAKNIIFNDLITYYYNIGNQNSITKNYGLRNLKSYISVNKTIFREYYCNANGMDKEIIGSYILKLQINTLSGFYRFLKKNKGVDFRSEGEELINKHLKDTQINDFLNKNSKQKEIDLFVKYAKINPKIAFKLIRNTNKKSFLKTLENLYLKSLCSD